MDNAALKYKSASSLTFEEVCVKFKISLTGFVTNWCSVGKVESRLMKLTAPSKMNKSQLIQSLLISSPVSK